MNTGKLLAAYCTAIPSHTPTRVTAIYREVVPIEQPMRGSYTAVSWKDGYVGFAGNVSDDRGVQVNFSVFESDALPVAPADTRYGFIASHPFTHEGAGWAGRLAYPWQTGERYRIYVTAEIDELTTTYAAWIGRGDEWTFCGRIMRTGHGNLYPGGFVEQHSLQSPERVRATGFANSWLYDGEWWPCDRVTVLRRDPLNADYFVRDGLVVVRIGAGLTMFDMMKNSTVVVPRGELPRLPHPPGSLDVGLLPSWQAMRNRG